MLERLCISLRKCATKPTAVSEPLGQRGCARRTEIRILQLTFQRVVVELLELQRRHENRQVLFLLLGLCRLCLLLLRLLLLLLQLLQVL